MVYHFRAELLERNKVGFVFNATAEAFSAINDRLSSARDAIVGGVSVGSVELSMGEVTLQVLETDGFVELSGDMESNWTSALMSGRDVTYRMSPRTPRDIMEDEKNQKGKPLQFDPKSRDVFIVHGHDHTALHHVARVISQLRLSPIILSEEPSGGKTIIEKLEQHAQAGFAVVLLTPDDFGYAAADGDAKLKPRARQNVILELGYFVGRLGRNRVCALVRGEVEIPSDWHGVIYHPLDAGQGWQLILAKEIKAAGFDIDLNLL